MNLEQQVTNLEISKKLKELGVDAPAMFWWREEQGEWTVGQTVTMLPAFTVAELGEMLPVFVGTEWLQIQPNRSGDYWMVFYGDGQPKMEREKHLANAVGKMLIYLIEDNLI